MVIKKQSGFVLLSVLIITSITTMLAFSQINNNRLQERIGGNQQKELSARFAAEKGIFSAFESIKDLNAQGESNEYIKAQLDNLSGDDYSLPSIALNGDTFTLLSKGNVAGASSYLKAEIEAIEESGVFSDAVVGCNSVDIGGSAKIDSFKGQAYTDGASQSNGDVKVINGWLTLGNGAGSDNKGIYGNAAANAITGNLDLVQGSTTTGYVGDASDCDPLGIVTMMAGIAGSGGTTRTSFASSDTFTDGNVYFYDDFNIDNDDLVISGDVTLYIEGEMSTQNTTFTLANDTSSLTIFIEGNMDIGTGSNIFAGEYVSDSGDIPLTVYSSNTGSELSNANNADTAVHLAGNADIYMNLYAPLGAVYYTGSGDIMGALRGGVVDISGNGDIHYDESLADIGDAATAGSVSYASIYYHYPEN